MKNRAQRTPKFKDEDQEAKWWASAKGREFLEQQSAAERLKSEELASRDQTEPY